MAKGLFKTGFTIEEILAIQATAKKLLIEGKTIMGWNDSGSSVSKEFPMPVERVLEECAHALQALDPATYGRGRRVAVSRVGVIHK